MKKKVIVSFLSIFILIVILYLGIRKIEGHSISKTGAEEGFVNPIKSGHEGEHMPSIEILLADSLTVFDLAKVQNGKPTVLFYFGPYCPYCKAEIDEILKNFQELKQVSFYLITPYPYADMKVFYNEHELGKYHNIKVGIDYQFKFGKYFNTQMVPYMAIYNSKGVLNLTFQGYVPYRQIKALTAR